MNWTTDMDIIKLDSFIIKSPDSFNIRKETRTSILQAAEGNMESQLSVEASTALTNEARKALMDISDAASDLKDLLM